MLKNIKTICFDFVKDLVMDESDIFVIDNKFMNKNLFEDIILKHIKRRKDLFVNNLNNAIFLNTKDTKKIFQQAQRHGVDNILDFYSSDSIPLWTDTEINFAITGDSGTGKSSFINAVRGIKAYEKGAAAVDVTEMTNKPTRYSHPKHEKIIFWDLPGIGTPTYPNYKEYCKKIGGLEKYDAFLIFCKTRFTQYDKELAEKVSKDLDKPFFFVRTNVDNELKNAEDDEGPKFNEASVMKRMRENCLKSLGDLIHDENDIFLIDNKFTEKYDFQRLKESIAEALPKEKQESFVASLEKLTHTIIRIKANILKAQLSKVIVLLMIAESEPEVFKNLILQEVIRYHRVFVQLGKKEEELLKNEHLKEIEQELKKEKSVGNSKDEENIEERKPESVGNSIDEESIEERKPESVGNSEDKESIKKRKPESVGNSIDEENIEERKPESVGNSKDEESIEERKPVSVGNSINEESIEERKPESVVNSIDEENIEERKPESVGNSIDEQSIEERKPESVGNSHAKVQWAYNYLIDCINNLENQLACKN
ncbi:interferon-inducible GTPase 1-like [Xenia sp. Carnegie-2017]|uniref:interferon-inducible GTPase 1-like n=1 Tax=Xenia sp. Carnegie-2017 TaxID=2897299 RepID=UPI001F0483EB|nr:interferon-inducible GTPase 1-like [Xenia sp. Carnegie-2017]XP_046843680.1 interferon-inducible GTPase 1-like [Xenia sp. Carnegie-2017]